MSQFDLQPLDAPAEPSAPAKGFDLQPVETAPLTEGDNLGVTQMPSRAEHMRVLAEIQAEPVSLTAYKAARGPAPEQATKALALAKKTGFSPQFAADNAEQLQQQADLSGFEDMLGSSPVLAGYAGQSGVHASAVKDDVGSLEALEQGLMDVGYQEWATAQMSFPTSAGEQILRNYETETAAFDQRPSGIAADFARSAPSLAAYYLAGILGRRLGGKPGEIGATAGLMYGLNRGALYRRILQSAPNADQLALQYTEEHPGEDVSDEKYAAFVREGQDFEKKARVYATVGATASAALGAGLSSAVSLAVPGAARKVQTISTEIIARAFADKTTRAVVEKLAAAGGHTLAGALYMAVPAVVDDATVQEAVTGEIDFGKALETGWDAFKKSLLAAGVLSTAPHVVPIVRDFARARQAPAEVARLDHLVEQAQASKLRQRSPAEFEQVAGGMAAQGDAATVYVDGEAAQRPEVAQKLVEALADDGQALAEAQATGGDVAVPTEKYLTVLADQHQALREDVKLSPDGATLREAQEVLNGPVAKLLAERTVLDQQPDSPEKRAALQDLHERMRDVVASQYRADPQEYAKAFTDQAQKMLAAAAAPSPAVGASLPADAEAWARKLANEKTIADLQPGRYELAARRAEDKLAQIATRAAEKGQEAARQAFVGAGAQAAGGEQTPAAGAANLREAGKKADVAARKLGEVPQLERARDLARAQASVHEEVQAEMQKARDYIAKRDTDKYRAELAKASPEYLEAFNTLQEAVDENTPRAAPNPLALDALLARMDSDAEPVAFDADQLRAVLEQPRGWKGLTPPEARTVFDAVKNIRAAAKRQNEIALADRKETLREFVTSTREHLDSIARPDSGLPSPSRASQGKVERAGAQVGNIATELLQPLRILRDRLGDPGNAIADAYVKARNAKEEFARQVGDHFYKAYEVGLPKELKKTRFDGVNGPGSPVFADDKWTRQDLWEFASWWGSESGADRIKRGLRITDGQAHEFMSQLTNAEADLLESKLKLNDEKLWPLIRDHTREVAGTSPTKIEARPFTIRTAEGDVRELRGGYEPARYRTDAESTAKAPTEAETIADYWGTLRDGFDSTASYFLKERAQKTGRVPDLNWSMYASHVNSVLHYLAYDDFVRNTGRVFRDPEFRELVQRRLGPQEMQELDKFLGVAARGFVEPAQDGAGELNRFLGNGLRGRWATAAFQLNPRVVWGQTSHLAAAIPALKLGPSDFLYGLAQALRPSTWGESFDVSEQLPYRWDGYGRKMREMLSNIGPSDKPLTRKWLDAAGWSGYHVMDGFLSKAIYEAAASKAERAGADPVAVRQAGDRAVELMMPPLNLAEQSSFARDRGVVGALILVRNFPNTLYNVGAKLEWDARNQVIASDPGWQRAKVALGSYGAAAASYLGTVWAAHILGRFLMGHGRQQDESTSEWLEREALTAPFYPFPFGEGVVAPLAEAAVTRKTLKQAVQRQSLSAAPAIAEIQRAIQDLGKVVDSGPSEDRVFAGLRLAANALRLPSEPLKGIRYGYDLTAGNVQPRGPFDVAGGFFYGQRPRQPKNPATVTQDFLSGD